MFEQLEHYGVVPVLSVPSEKAGINVCEALLAGNLPVAEITFRTEAAADTIRKISEQYPEMLVGAGTLLSEDDIKRARDSGAQFGVAPGCTRNLLHAAAKHELPFAPGVSNASDIQCAIEEGVYDLKFFPSESLGGTKMLKALSAPFAHTGIRFCPTGGIKASNMQEYLALDTVPVVAGSWIAKKDKIENGEWDDITRLACEAVHTARQA